MLALFLAALTSTPSLVKRPFIISELSSSPAVRHDLDGVAGRWSSSSSKLLKLSNMPKIKEKKTRPIAFFYSNDAAAVVYLLRASDSTTWKKFCPDIENHGAATGADDIMMSMFRALHGGLEQTDDLADEGGSKS